MHFERRNAFQNAKNDFIFFFPRKKNNKKRYVCLPGPTVPKIYRPITWNTLIFVFGLARETLVLIIDKMKAQAKGNASSPTR